MAPTSARIAVTDPCTAALACATRALSTSYRLIRTSVVPRPAGRPSPR